MPRIICSKCGLDFVVKKVGVAVIDVAYDPPDVQRVQRADLLQCPGCGASVVAGLSAPSYNEDTLKQYAGEKDVIYAFESERMKMKFKAGTNAP